MVQMPTRVWGHWTLAHFTWLSGLQSFSYLLPGSTLPGSHFRNIISITSLSSRKPGASLPSHFVKAGFLSIQGSCGFYPKLWLANILLPVRPVKSGSPLCHEWPPSHNFWAFDYVALPYPPFPFQNNSESTSSIHVSLDATVQNYY